LVTGSLSHRFELRPCQTETGRIRRSREIWGFRSGVWTGLIKAMRLCNPMAPLRCCAWGESAYQQVLCRRSAVGAATTSSVQGSSAARCCCAPRTPWYAAPSACLRSRIRPRGLLQRTGYRRLAACCAHPGSVGGWIVLHATNSLVRWCIRALGKAVRQILGEPGSSDLRRHPGTALPQ
jgi:hypothetical protein